MFSNLDKQRTHKEKQGMVRKCQGPPTEPRLWLPLSPCIDLHLFPLKWNASFEALSCLVHVVAPGDNSKTMRENDGATLLIKTLK